MEDFKKEVIQLIDKAGLSFIGSVDEDGYPAIRAMLRPRKYDENGTIWFSTNTQTNKIRHFMRSPKACVYVCSQSNFAGALLQGEMEILEDSASKAMLWEEGDELYYPGGVQDPNYCILLFKATRGRYYHDFSSADFTLG